MLAVRMDEEHIRDLLIEFPGLSLAALNGPQLVVVSGEQRVLDRVAQDLKDRRIAARKMPLSHQFDPPIREPLWQHSGNALTACHSHRRESSSLKPDGRPVRTEIMNSDYWCDLSSLSALSTVSGHWPTHAIDSWNVPRPMRCRWPDGFSGKIRVSSPTDVGSPVYAREPRTGPRFSTRSPNFTWQAWKSTGRASIAMSAGRE